MNIIEELLAHDPAKIKPPTGTVEIALSRFGGKVWAFPIQAIDAEYASQLQEESMEISMDDDDMQVKMRNTHAVMVKTIIAGCPEIFQSDKLKEKWNLQTNKQLVHFMLEQGEMNQLKKAIDNLSKSEIKVIKDDELKN